MHNFTKRLLPYTIFVLSYITLFLFVAITSGNTEFLFYIGTMIIFITVIVFMDKRVNFSPLVLSGLTLWGFLHLAGGLVPIPNDWTLVDSAKPVLYDLKPHDYFPKYDQIIHALGFGVSLIAAHEALQIHLKRTLPLTLAICATLFFIAIGLGALNEMLEFIAVISMANTNVGGYINTGWDLVSNAVGACIGLLILKTRVRN